MLKIGVARLKRLLPHAVLKVITGAPELLSDSLPDVEPLTLHGRRLFLQDRNLFGAAHRVLAGGASQVLARVESGFRRSWPRSSAAWAGLRMRRRGVDDKPMRDFLRAVAGCRAVVVTGGGFITDPFEDHAFQVLELLAIAKSLGKPIALFGQGIGPVGSPKLLRLAKTVLGSADLITLREGRSGLPILSSLGVAPDRVVVTGDDAIEMAFDLRPSCLGDAIGFNLRLAEYSGVGKGEMSAIIGVVKGFAEGRGSRVLPVPIAWGEADSDIRSLADGSALDADSLATLDSIATPEDVIRQVGRCRLVVTGSYHAGVFALSQGIPVVGIARSPYYKDKFSGLAEQFGCGCETILIDDVDVGERLVRTISRLWDAAEGMRSPLLLAAEGQIASSREAYERFAAILDQGASPS